MMWGYKTGTYLKSGKHLLEGRARTWSNPRKYLLFFGRGKKGNFSIDYFFDQGCVLGRVSLKIFLVTCIGLIMKSQGSTVGNGSISVSGQLPTHPSPNSTKVN